MLNFGVRGCWLDLLVFMVSILCVCVCVCVFVHACMRVSVILDYSHAEEVSKCLEEVYFAELKDIQVDGNDIDVPRPLPW